MKKEKKTRENEPENNGLMRRENWFRFLVKEPANEEYGISRMPSTFRTFDYNRNIYANKGTKSCNEATRIV